MTNYVINNMTSNGKQVINLSMNIIPVENVLVCAQEDKVRNSCKTGCLNYGKKWSCPPYSIKFSDIVKFNEYNMLIVLVGYINLSDMKYINNSYQQVKAANMILKSKCEKLARNIENEFKGYSLLSGSCNLCKPCQKKKDLPCKKPLRARYSLESTGINVQELLERYCEHKLLWYKKGEKITYTSVATAILVDSNNQSKTNMEVLVEKYIKEIIKEY